MLAREVLVEADTPFDAREIVRGLVASQPGSFVYASEGFVGASPELLVRRTGAVVESRPVAGTTVADSDEALLALAASVKDTEEHRFVVDGIVDALDAALRDLTVATTPEVAVFGPVAHLATPIRGRLLRARAQPRSTLARLLHPTPAVGGTPRAAALDAIRALEGFDRGRYAGPGRLGRRARRRRVGHRPPRRRARRRPGPPRRRRRHRRRFGTRRRVGRDPGQARAHAAGPRPPLTPRPGSLAAGDLRRVNRQ